MLTYLKGGPLAGKVVDVGETARRAGFFCAAGLAWYLRHGQKYELVFERLEEGKKMPPVERSRHSVPEWARAARLASDRKARELLASVLARERRKAGRNGA